jgi:hypothetical protein
MSLLWLYCFVNESGGCTPNEHRVRRMSFVIGGLVAGCQFSTTSQQIAIVVFQIIEVVHVVLRVDYLCGLTTRTITGRQTFFHTYHASFPCSSSSSYTFSTNTLPPLSPCRLLRYQVPRQPCTTSVRYLPAYTLSYLPKNCWQTRYRR